MLDCIVSNDIMLVLMQFASAAVRQISKPATLKGQDEIRLQTKSNFVSANTLQPSQIE